MAVSVSLDEIITALEAQSEDYSQFVDPETGEVHVIEDSLIDKAEAGEEPDQLPEWQQDQWETIKLLVETGRFLRLPTQYDIHEWQIMENFAYSVELPAIRDELLKALHGRGAFRWFKDRIHAHNIQKDWYAYRAEALRQIAIDWCEENHLRWH